jgi:hypothetical protein
MFVELTLKVDGMTCLIKSQRAIAISCIYKKLNGRLSIAPILRISAIEE